MTDLISPPPAAPTLGRRTFVKGAGAAAGVAALALAGCRKKDPEPDTSTLTFGTGDVGALNFAYTLAQLQAAFYAQVVAAPATDFQTNELAYCTAMGRHQNVHRDYLRFLLNRDFNGQLVSTLATNFTGVNFTQRASVLGTARTLEEASVAAYNGLAGLLTSPDYLLAVAKLVSVEARHAALVRTLLAPADASNFFAGDGQVDPATGLDRGLLRPSAVVPLVQPFSYQPLNVSALG